MGNYTINPMPKQISDADVKLLEQVETATVGHVLHSQFASHDITPVLMDKRIAGTAVTVRIPNGDSTLLHYVMGLVRPGDFVVVDRCGDTKHACWGGVVTNAAKIAGVVGAIVDGPATDVSEFRKVDFPMWSKGISPITTKLLDLEGAINIPVSIGGTVVHPGDAVLADDCGVLFLHPEQIEPVATRAIDMQEKEITTLERLRQGEKLPNISPAGKMVEQS